MKNNKTFFIIFGILSAIIFSACGSGSSFIADSWPGITVVEDTIYIANNQHIYAVNTKNGQEIARYPKEVERGGPTFFAPPIITEDQTIVASAYNNTLYTYDLNTGAELWNLQNSNRFIASPLVTENAIYAPNSDNDLHALDRNGNFLWSFETGSSLWASPVSNGKSIFQVSMDGSIYAINPGNGQEIWSTELGGAVVSTPALSENGSLYLGTFQSEVVAINTANGNVLWRADTNGWVWASPTLDGETLYITDMDGYLYALDSDSGRQKWFVKGDGTISGSALVHNDTIYFSTDAGTLYAISLDGDIRWSRSAGEEVILYGSPTAAGELILVSVVESDFIVIAWDANGTIQWQFTPEN